jgi:hypothetical protein
MMINKILVKLKLPMLKDSIKRKIDIQEIRKNANEKDKFLFSEVIQIFCRSWLTLAIIRNGRNNL